MNAANDFKDLNVTWDYLYLTTTQLTGASCGHHVNKWFPV